VGAYDWEVQKLVQLGIPGFSAGFSLYSQDFGAYRLYTPVASFALFRLASSLCHRINIARS